MFKLFFSPIGPIGRRDFWIGFVGLFIFVTLTNAVLRRLEPGWGPLITSFVFICLIFYLIGCVYGKRLVDSGRTRWPLTGAIALQIIFVIAVILMFGGAEFFAEFSKFDRKDDIDPAISEAITARYQDKMTANMGVIRGLMLVVPVAFTIWVGTRPTRPKKD